MFSVMLVADHQLHGRACCGYRVIWNCFSGTWILTMRLFLGWWHFLTYSFLKSSLLSGKMLGNWRDCGHKEGFTGQKIQESWAAANAHHGSSKCHFFETLFLFYYEQGWAFPQLGDGICSRDHVWGVEALQQCKTENASYICETVHLPSMCEASHFWSWLHILPLISPDIN